MCLNWEKFRRPPDGWVKQSHLDRNARSRQDPSEVVESVGASFARIAQIGSGESLPGIPVPFSQTVTSCRAG
jgi:hypothetical protein